MPYDPERVGIVGASGNIGSALARSLVADGQSPRLFGRRAGQIEGLLIESLNSDSAQFSGLDCIIHMSAITISRASDDELRQANVDLAVDTARRAAEAGVKRFIFLSSLHVHGKSAVEAISPATPFKGDNAYGRSKAQAEVALASVAKETGLDLIVLRPPMVYGPGSKGSFPLLAKLVRTGLPLPLAAARSRRSFCSIANLISAVRYAVAAPAPASVLIPADPEDFSTPELVAAMAGAIGREVPLWRIPRALVAAPLGLIGRQEMVTSLFESLQVDRTHWADTGWCPVETGQAGMRHALTPQPSQPLALYVTNITPYFLSHRLALAQTVRAGGFRLALAGGDVEQYRDVLEGAAIEPMALPRVSRSFSPSADVRSALALARLIRRHRPAVVHATGLKTMFLCALASWVSKPQRVVCIVTGLGLTYVDDTARNRLVRVGVETVLRTLLLRSSSVTVFQNSDDHAYFLQRGVVRKANSVVIKGSGVDISHYASTPEPEGDPPLVVFPARLLKSKGVLEFAAAAQMIRQRGVPARFALVGDIDPNNPDSITQEALDALVADGAVEVWGFRPDMATVFAACHLVCLPSYYREGVPKALIEAASTGRAIVTCDVPGCREIVVHGLSGHLCTPQDVVNLADMLEPLLRDGALRRRMGAAGRQRVEAEFSNEVVLKATSDLYFVEVPDVRAA